MGHGPSDAIVLEEAGATNSFTERSDPPARWYDLQGKSSVYSWVCGHFGEEVGLCEDAGFNPEVMSDGGPTETTGGASKRDKKAFFRWSPWKKQKAEIN